MTAPFRPTPSLRVVHNESSFSSRNPEVLFSSFPARGPNQNEIEKDWLGRHSPMFYCCNFSGSPFLLIPSSLHCLTGFMYKLFSAWHPVIALTAFATIDLEETKAEREQKSFLIKKVRSICDGYAQKLSFVSFFQWKPARPSPGFCWNI